VDSASLEVTLSEPYRYATDYNYSVYATIVGLTHSSFLLFYFDSFEQSDVTNTVDGMAGGSGFLTAILATILTSGEISFSNATSSSASLATFSVCGSRLDNFSAVVAFADRNSDFGVTAQLVRLVQEEDSNGLISSSIGDSHIL